MEDREKEEKKSIEDLLNKNHIIKDKLIIPILHSLII